MQTWSICGFACTIVRKAWNYTKKAKLCKQYYGIHVSGSIRYKPIYQNDPRHHPTKASSSKVVTMCCSDIELGTILNGFVYHKIQDLRPWTRSLHTLNIYQHQWHCKCTATLVAMLTTCKTETLQLLPSLQLLHIQHEGMITWGLFRKKSRAPAAAPPPPKPGIPWTKEL